MSRIQRGDAAYAFPQQQYLVECRTICGLGKPFDEPNAIVIREIVSTQPRKPLSRFVGLVLLTLY